MPSDFLLAALKRMKRHSSRFVRVNSRNDTGWLIIVIVIYSHFMYV